MFCVLHSIIEVLTGRESCGCTCTGTIRRNVHSSVMLVTANKSFWQHVSLPFYLPNYDLIWISFGERTLKESLLVKDQCNVQRMIGQLSLWKNWLMLTPSNVRSITKFGQEYCDLAKEGLKDQFKTVWMHHFDLPSAMQIIPSPFTFWFLFISGGNAILLTLHGGQNIQCSHKKDFQQSYTKLIMLPLGESYQPGPWDVICARGKAAYCQ